VAISRSLRAPRTWLRALALAALFSLSACHRGAVDTTKTYYEDSEAPAFQVQITNGVEKHVPWAEVPEANRYILEYDDPPGPRPRVRVPIVKVTTVARDEKGNPAPPDQAYTYRYVEEGLNPKYKRDGMGGKSR
jgi:hypothetical protein